jgi:hypothetical protein
MEIKILDDNQVIPADPKQNTETFKEFLSQNLGFPYNVPLYTAIDQLFGNLMEITKRNEEEINCLLAILEKQKPKSLLESQLIVQILMCHRLCTKMLKKVANETFPEITDKYLNMAMKLSRNFNRGMETLSKIRRGGKQHIIVEKVVVEKNAQAIIGNVSKGE